MNGGVFEAKNQTMLVQPTGDCEMVFEDSPSSASAQDSFS